MARPVDSDPMFVKARHSARLAAPTTGSLVAKALCILSLITSFLCHLSGHDSSLVTGLAASGFVIFLFSGIYLLSRHEGGQRSQWGLIFAAGLGVPMSAASVVMSAWLGHSLGGGIGAVVGVIIAYYVILAIAFLLGSFGAWGVKILPNESKGTQAFFKCVVWLGWVICILSRVIPTVPNISLILLIGGIVIGCGTAAIVIVKQTISATKQIAVHSRCHIV